MTSLRKAKKALRSRAARGEALGVGEVLALPPVRGIPRPVPCPPNPHGQNLVPAGYVGWILITTPTRRRKVRWLAGDGRVYRDDHCRRGGRFTLAVHARACRVEPCTVYVGFASPGETVHSLLITAGVLGGRRNGRSALQEAAQGQLVSGGLAGVVSAAVEREQEQVAAEVMLCAGLPGPEPMAMSTRPQDWTERQAALIWPQLTRRGARS